jgi:hypothetical protein
MSGQATLVFIVAASPAPNGAGQLNQERCPMYRELLHCANSLIHGHFDRLIA